MSDLTEIITTVSLLVGGLLLILSAYIFGVCKNKNHNNFIIFNTLLMIYDWVFYIIFTIWISTTDMQSILVIIIPLMSSGAKRKTTGVTQNVRMSADAAACFL
ncbi:unnamed protein product [Rhizophagus irregularis]|nr:unnamed protein product [Rhizophagus irregularis]